MNLLKGIVRDGQIRVSEPVTWPDGTQVQISPLTASGELNGHDGEFGTSEEQQSDDPESIARWIAEFDAIPPLQMRPEEEAEWRAARKAQKDLELATFNERAEKFQRMLE